MFDATRPTAAPRILALFGTKPRALAASADGRYVFVAVFHSGNGTATVSGEDVVRLGRAPRLYFNRIPYSAIPKQGAVVRRMNDRWQDYQNRDWTAVVPFELPDYDVFVIDAAGETPKELQSISNVGTILSTWRYSRAAAKSGSRIRKPSTLCPMNRAYRASSRTIGSLALNL